MITVSDNDLRTLIQYVQDTAHAVAADNAAGLRLYNRTRQARLTVRKLMRRKDVQRITATKTNTGGKQHGRMD